MTIARPQFEYIGARMWQPEGPFDGVVATPSFAPGTVVAGDGESEYVYLLYNAIAPVTVRQGQFLVWDNSYLAFLAATATTSRGMSGGTVFLGGGALGAGAPFSYTFPMAGTYGIWAQRAGTSLLNVVTGAANAYLAETTTTAGTIGAPASPTATSKLLTGVYLTPATFTCTVNNANGSNVVTPTVSTNGLVVGQTVSGTGIATGSYITAISGASVTLSQACTSTNAGITMTATQYSTYVTTTNGSPVLTNVTTLYGMYPGQTIAGTGIPASTTILAINAAGPNTITMSANATATANNINATGSLLVEGYLKWPYVDKTN